MTEDETNKIISLAKRRGFIFPSSEIYGGLNGFYDFGPLGSEMKRKIKSAWLSDVKRNENIVSFDSAIILNPRIWQASGHLSAGFADELVECKKCHKRFRVDEIKKKGICPECGGELTKPRQFNLMMKTFIGPIEDESSTAYLRAETCQGIFINYSNILKSQRLKIPFGVVQIGKSFRNEINPKNFIFRTREFEQMEMEWFCPPDESDKWFDFWLEKRLNWYYQLGIKKENIRTIEVPKEERSHYARRQVDIEYHFPFGWKEIEGIHNRGDWDLSNHSKHSGEDLSYVDENGKKYYPYVIETSVGAERSLFAFLVEGYTEVEGGRTKTTESVKEIETVLRLNEKIAPLTVAVFPLVKNKKEITEKAKEVFRQLKDRGIDCYYDETGSIGRRYRRADEIGIPYAITIDFQTIEDYSVTVRYRDTMEQKRIKISELRFKI